MEHMIEETLKAKNPEIFPASNVILSVENVSKRFCRDLKRSMYYGIKDIASEVMGRQSQRSHLRKGEFWALENISFELRQGEAVGLVGANGAGKTTILKIISGLIKPDTGRIRVSGRLAPLIALGAGFNPILKGRENIFVNMAILGLTKKEIEERYDEVVAFSEVGHAIEAPVQTYSSGMAARLGFACAIHTSPDILLIDEVLAVGDIKFRMKCYRRLAKLREQGTSFILVSHSTQSVLSVCNTGVYLEKGKVKALGDIGAVLSKYEDDLFPNPTENFLNRIVLAEKKKEDSEGLDILEVAFKNDKGSVVEDIISGIPIFMCIKFRSHEYIDKFSVKLIIREMSQENDYMLSIDSANDKHFFSTVPGRGEINLRFPQLGLRKGVYNTKISLSRDGLLVYDAIESFKFVVKSTDKNMIESSFYQPRDWQLVNQ